jgi:hypothetical protein
MNPDSPGSVHQNWINEAEFLAEHDTIPGVPDIPNLLESKFVMSLYKEQQ